MILSLIAFLILIGNAHSFFFQGCFVVPNWESMKSKLSDKQNNPKCIEFCRQAFYALAATSDTRCVCMDNLPKEVVAFPVEGNAAAGSTSRCNIQCPGIEGNRCDSETCCGGLDNAFSVYATGNIDFVTKLLHNLGRKIDTIMKLFADDDLPEWSHLQFKIRMTENVERSCIMTLLQPVTSSQCLKVTDKSHIFAPYVEFEVERIEEEVAKSYPTQSHSLDIPGLELDNTDSKTEAKMTRKQDVKATTMQRYTTESGTENCFTIGPSVSAGLKAFGSEFSVKLSTEYANSSFYNYAYQSVFQESITDTFEISTTVPAGIRKVVRFAKKFADRTLKWRSTCYAKGEIVFFPLSGAKNISLSQILSSEERTFYVFGTIMGEANPTISAMVYSYDAKGHLIDTKPAASSEAQPVSSKPKKKKPTKPDHKNELNKEKKPSGSLPKTTDFKNIGVKEKKMKLKKKPRTKKDRST